MVELFEHNERKTDLQSSKGNQLKWENCGVWYKADYTGYEGLAEYVVSHLLQYSNLDEREFVLYETEQIRYRGRIYRGARSCSFLEQGWQIITLERLFQSFYGQSLNKSIWHLQDCSDRLKFLVSQTERITGLSDFGKYLGKLLTIDVFFLNEDRHTHNIAVLMNGTGGFKLCPIFDNGASLLADTTMDYPMGEDVYSLIGTVKAKTVSLDFEEQLEASDEVFGPQLRFSFGHEEVEKVLEQAEGYTPDEKQRVKTVIFEQMRKYAYLFR